MKKVFKWIGIGLGSIVGLILIGALYINFSPLKTYEVSSRALQVDLDSISVSEGKRIATFLCSQCHMGTDGKLSGNFMEEGEFGTVYAANITQDPQNGIGQYTDGEIEYLLRTGINRQGQYTPPFMVKLPHMSDEDLQDIVAFLRSDDPLVQPSQNEVPATQYSFLAKALMKLGAFGPLPFPEQQIVAPDPSDPVEFGEYLAVAKYDCYGCHSANFQTVNLMEPALSEGFFGGGNPFKIPGQEEPIVSANLTFDKQTGIGMWTEEEFSKALRQGVTPDGRAVRPPMMPFNQLTDTEASAIYAYLKSLPVIKNEKLLARFGKR